MSTRGPQAHPWRGRRREVARRRLRLPSFAALLLALGAVVAATASASHVPGATYEGSTAIGGTVRVIVSGDGSQVDSFKVTLTPPGSCGTFESIGYGGDPIVNHAFSYNDAADDFSYSGSFPSAQQAQGMVTFDNPFDPACSFNTSWTAGVLHTLNVILAGAGAGEGRVVSTPYAIDCPGTCSAQFGGSVTLNPDSSGFVFLANWSGGGCSGDGSCVVQMDADKTVTATFERWTLEITKHPPKKTEKEKAKFKFDSNRPRTTYECSRDEKSPKKCDSPVTYKHLKPGRHSFQVQALTADSQGFGPIETFNWKVKR